MADFVSATLQVLAEIRDVAKSIEGSSRQARRLSERVADIEPVLTSVQQGGGRLSSSSPALRRLLPTATKIRQFLEEYARMPTLDRAAAQRKNATKFAQLGVALDLGTRALQLGDDVDVDARGKEDASDRQEDLESLVDLVAAMEREGAGNGAGDAGGQERIAEVLKVRLCGRVVWCGVVVFFLLLGGVRSRPRGIETPPCVAGVLPCFVRCSRLFRRCSGSTEQPQVGKQKRADEDKDAVQYGPNALRRPPVSSRLGKMPRAAKRIS